MIIHQLNACHLYLQVTLLSDITTLDGLRLGKTWYNGKLPPIPHSKQLFPIQPRPNKTVWSHWHTYLSTLTINISLDLINPHQQWTKSGQELSYNWPALYDSSNKTLYIRTPNLRYEIFYRLHSQTNRSHSSGQTTEFVSRNALPITTEAIAQRILIHSPPQLVTPYREPTSATFDDYLQSLPKWESNLLQIVTMTNNIFRMSEVFQSATSSSPLLIATDSSAPQFDGSYGWIISTSSGDRITTNYGRVQGMRITLFRAERYGLLSVLCFIHRVSIFTNTRTTRMTILIDSKSVICRVNKLLQWDSLYPNLTTIPEYDVLQAIVCLIKTLRYPPTLQFIRGHQDRLTTYSDLSLKAQLNVDADPMAGTEDRSNSTLHLTADLITGSAISVHTSLATFTSHLPNQI